MAFNYTLIPPIIQFNFLKQGLQEHIFFEWLSHKEIIWGYCVT